MSIQSLTHSVFGQHRARSIHLWFHSQITGRNDLHSRQSRHVLCENHPSGQLQRQPPIIFCVYRQTSKEPHFVSMYYVSSQSVAKDAKDLANLEFSTAAAETFLLSLRGCWHHHLVMPMPPRLCQRIQNKWKALKNPKSAMRDGELNTSVYIALDCRSVGFRLVWNSTIWIRSAWLLSPCTSQFDEPYCCERPVLWLLWKQGSVKRMQRVSPKRIASFFQFSSLHSVFRHCISSASSTLHNFTRSCSEA